MACSSHFRYDYDCGPCRDARSRELRDQLDKQEASGDLGGSFRSAPKGECDKHFTYHSDCPGCRVEHYHLEEWRSARSRSLEREEERRRDEKRDRRRLRDEERARREDEDRDATQYEDQDDWDPIEETWHSGSATGSSSGTSTGDDWLILFIVIAVVGFILSLIIYALTGIGSFLATWGSAQLEEWGLTRPSGSASSSSSSSSASQETVVDREGWSGRVTGPGGERLGGLLMTLENNTVTSLTMAIDSEGCPKALDLRGRAQIDSSTVRITLGRQRDEAVLKGKFQDGRFEGRLSVGVCELDARVAARPRDG